jgi:trans-2,3-dihydro-3-hydroxyanthranilate isomerase
MRAYRYLRIDVFTDKAFGGNPLAVFPTAQGLDAHEMQLLAKEMHLSETTFVLPPTRKEAAARVRIFTVDRELPLAGHPVVGTAFALAATSAIPVRPGTNRIALELGAGVLPVDIEVHDGKVTSVVMTQRAPTFGAEITDVRRLAAALSLSPDQLDLGGLRALVVDTGIPWFLVPVKDKRALSSLRADGKLCEQLAKEVGTDLFHAFTQDTGDPDCAVRTRHVWWGTVTPGEDPVTGSAIGCVASYLVGEGVILAAPVAELAIEQGEDVGRPGKVFARIKTSGGRVTGVQVGGSSVHVGNGEVWLE